MKNIAAGTLKRIITNALMLVSLKFLIGERVPKKVIPGNFLTSWKSKTSWVEKESSL